MLRHVAPHLYRITMPLPFEIDNVSVHLLESDNGWILVDCGLKSRECEAALDSGLAEAGLTRADIHTLVITHAHPDHIGLAADLMASGVRELIMNPVERKALDRLSSLAESGADIDDAFALAGVPDTVTPEVKNALYPVRRMFRPLSPTRLVSDGDVIRSRAGDWRVIETPGHAPGHLCLYQEESGLLLSGDHILDGITPNISWDRGHDRLNEYLLALDRLKPLRTDLILPSHGEPFQGHVEWIGVTAGHHGERCAQLRALTAQPHTAHELVAGVWPFKLSPFNYRFAVYEVLAHLEYMRRRGETSLELRDQTGFWYSTQSSVRSSG
ncbi:MAG: MBL fold metallo-hydrolase [Acidobacteria bacterium]|nr:MBL fold metallo-hydrolase [Acidobacteriota bacterium]